MTVGLLALVLKLTAQLNPKTKILIFLKEKKSDRTFRYCFGLLSTIVTFMSNLTLKSLPYSGELTMASSRVPISTAFLLVTMVMLAYPVAKTGVHAWMTTRPPPTTFAPICRTSEGEAVPWGTQVSIIGDYGCKVRLNFLAIMFWSFFGTNTPAMFSIGFSKLL